MYVLADLTRAQAIARAYLHALDASPDLLLDLLLHDAQATPAIREIFEDTCTFLLDGQFGAPTEEDVCRALAHPRAHIYGGHGGRITLLITTGPQISDGVLHERRCANKVEARNAAALLGAIPHNYRG